MVSEGKSYLIVDHNVTLDFCNIAMQESRSVLKKVCDLSLHWSSTEQGKL